MGNKFNKLVGLSFHKNKPTNAFRVSATRDSLPIGFGQLIILPFDLVFVLEQLTDGRKTEKWMIWPIRGIRRYGATEGTFSIESGRRYLMLFI